MRVFAFSLLFLSAICLNAQTNKPNFISLNAGFNYPTGDYKDVELKPDLPSANATQGYYGSMEFGVYFTKHLGLGFNLGGFYNEIDKEKFEDQMKEDFKNDPTKPAIAEINTSEWINVYAMAGPYLTFNVIDRFFIDFKFLAGAMSTNEPLLSLKVDNQTGDVTLIENNEADAIGFAFNYGMHIRIDLISKLGLRINAEGFSSQQQMERALKDGKLNTPATDSYSKESHFEQKVTAFNIGVGLVLTFD